MLPLRPEPDLAAAAARLSGHLVRCPVIGDLCLPGFAVPPGLRLKAELLQPGGSLWYRGAQHWLLRQMGRWKGLLCRGTPRQLLAWARAARDQRMPVVAVLADVADAGLRSACESLGVTVAPAPDLRGAHSGYVSTPAVDAADFALGVGTVVLELVDELPHDTERVVVAPAELAPAVAQAASSLGLPWRVEAGAQVHARAEAVAAALRTHHCLCTEPAGAAALAAALTPGGDTTCVVLGV